MTDVDEYLEHFGVKGMKWGVQRQEKLATKARAEAYKNEVLTDRKEKYRLDRTSYKGVMADRRAIKQKIKDRIANDPDYAAAVAKIAKDKATREKIISNVVLGEIAVGGLLSLAYVSGARPPLSLVEATNGLSNKAARRVNTFRDFHRSAKKSPYWNDMTIKGSATMVGTAMEVYRKFG